MKIIHPITQKKITIKSKKGTKLVKKYINYYKKIEHFGGNGGLCFGPMGTCINYVISAHACLLKGAQIRVKKNTKIYFYSKRGNPLSCPNVTQTAICSPSKKRPSPRITEICHNTHPRSPLPRCSTKFNLISDYLLIPDKNGIFHSGAVDCRTKNIPIKITEPTKLSSVIKLITEYHKLHYNFKKHVGQGQRHGGRGRGHGGRGHGYGGRGHGHSMRYVPGKGYWRSGYGTDILYFNPQIQIHCLFCRGFCSDTEMTAEELENYISELGFPTGLAAASAAPSSVSAASAAPSSAVPSAAQSGSEPLFLSDLESSFLSNPEPSSSDSDSDLISQLAKLLDHPSASAPASAVSVSASTPASTPASAPASASASAPSLLDL